MIKRSGILKCSCRWFMPCLFACIFSFFWAGGLFLAADNIEFMEEDRITAMVADAYYVDPETCIFADSSSRYLQDADLQPLTVQELCYARNEIYARHGVIFVSEELQDYFDQKYWYWGSVPSEAFSSDSLNSFEQANVLKLKDAEYERMPGGYQLDGDYTYRGIGSYSEKQDTAVDTAVSEDYIFSDSDSRYLEEEEIVRLPLQLICYARNEIYARKGYIFQSEQLREYFGGKSWYSPTVPASSFSDSLFNEYESANILLLKQIEYRINPSGYQLY